MSTLVYDKKHPPTTTHLPLTTVSEANRRDHWRVKSKRVRLQRRTAAALVPGCPLPCVVTLTRISPRMLDDDNLQSALKAVRDGVADRLGVDDRDPRVEWRYAQRKGAQKGVEVEFGVVP